MSFNDSFSGALIRKFTAEILPFQSGTGIPSIDNIRTISGYTDYYITGPKNQFNEDLANWENEKYLDNRGDEATSINYKYSKFYFPVLPSTTYTVQIEKNSSANVGFHVIQYKSNKVFNSRTVLQGNTTEIGVFSGTFTTQSDTEFIRLNVPKTNTTNIQVEIGTQKTSYEDNVIHINWQSDAGTVYGGTLEINEDKTVKLTKNKERINLASLSWTVANGSNGVEYYLTSCDEA